MKLDVKYFSLFGFVLFKVKESWDQLMFGNEQCMFIVFALVIYVYYVCFGTLDHEH